MAYTLTFFDISYGIFKFTNGYENLQFIWKLRKPFNIAGSELWHLLGGVTVIAAFLAPCLHL
jgi:hypothetical protein